MSIEEIVQGLLPVERARLSFRVGFPPADYDLVTADLVTAGLLNEDHTLTPLGLAVKARLEEAGDE